MKQEINFLTFSSEDLDSVRSFYSDGLGWTPLLDVPGEIVFFQIAPRMTLGFFDSSKFAEDLGDAAPEHLRSSTARGVTLAHNVDSREGVIALIDSMVSASAHLGFRARR